MMTAQQQPPPIVEFSDDFYEDLAIELGMIFVQVDGAFTFKIDKDSVPCPQGWITQREAVRGAIGLATHPDVLAKRGHAYQTHVMATCKRMVAARLALESRLAPYMDLLK